MSDQKNCHLHNEHLMKLVRDARIPAGDRADAVIFKVCEMGIDLRPTVRRMVEDADTGHKLKEKLDTLQAHPLASERFVGAIGHPRCYAAVTRGPNLIYLPAEPEEVAPLKQGDPVLVDLKEDRIVGRDGQIATIGDVATVDSLPADRPGQIVVKHNDRAQLAWLHHGLLDRARDCRPGTRVLYDALRRFVLAPVDTGTDGSELLADLSRLGKVRREEIGAPKPVADEIRSRVLLAVEHADWLTQLRARPRTSYLFVGGSGSGKSYTLKFIAEQLHDLVEQMTGERTSRVVICDASQFWHSLFGETEQRIAAWAEKLQKLGAKALTSRDGKPLHFPLMIVLEECEALLRIRGDQTGSGHLFDRPLSLLLQKTESIEAALQLPLIWVATTNRADLADPAALRRLGMRRVVFGNLSFDEAASVLGTKVPDDMPVRGPAGDEKAARDALFRRVLGYLYGPEPKQGLAEVRMVNSERRLLNRCDLVTPATLEEAVSAAIDDSLRASRAAGELLGLDADDIIRFLHRHYAGLARTLTRYNLPAYCPEWFDDGAHEVVSVTPLARRNRRAVPVLD